MDLFNAKNVAFVSVTQNFSTADAIGRLTLNMLMSFAEFEREMIAERTRDKISAARRKGKWTGGIVPMGYVTSDRRLNVQEGEAKVIRHLFSRYLEGQSAVRLAEWLNDQEIPLKNQQVPRERPWTKDLVLRILRNPLYRGLVHSRGVLYPGEHRALVDPGTFDRVQALLAPKARVQHWGTRNPCYLVRGTLKCGTCGSVMTTAPKIQEAILLGTTRVPSIQALVRMARLRAWSDQLERRQGMEQESRFESETRGQ